MTVGFRLDGCAGAVAAHLRYAREGARSFALVSLAAAEAFPAGALDGAVFHWGVASREGGAWVPPPDGWQSDPPRTTDAGQSWSLRPSQKTGMKITKRRSFLLPDRQIKQVICF